MDETESNEEKFTWIGKFWSDSTSKRRAKIHYDSFRKGSLTVTVQDHVLIRNDDSRDPENIEFCLVGKVLDLYEKTDDPDPYCCTVQWYSRLNEIPPRLQDEIQDKDYTQELILDDRSAWGDEVDAETIFKKCCVIRFAKDVPSCSIPDTLGDLQVFFCRYAFDGRKLRNVSEIKLKKAPKRSLKRPVTDLSQEDIAVDHTKLNGKISSSRKKISKRNVPNGNTSFNLNQSFEDKSQNRNETHIRRNERMKDSEIKSELISVQHENVNGHKETPSKNVLQPTPVKTFYSSEKKQPLLKDIDASRVRRVLPFDLPKKVTGENRVKSKSPKKGLKSGTETKREAPNLSSVRRTSKRSFLLNKENEITPYQKTRITRSGRKVQLPNYLEYWDSFSVSSDDSKRSKRSSDSSNKTGSSLSESGDSLNEGSEHSQPIKKSNKQTAVKKVKLKKTPTSLLRPRKTMHEIPKTTLEEARAYLHVSAVPESLPCRENEFSDICAFVEGKLLEKRGGCMYISGVPGTGKTATVHEVVRSLKESQELGHLPHFNFVEINALRLTNPHQSYIHLLKALKGTDATAKHAVDLLSTHFEEGRQKQMTVLMLDELDMLCTKRQDVLYNMFHWPSLPHSRLVVLAIANTMDLPERLLANKIVSRLGLTRMTFQPYTFKQLQEIIMSRIQGLGAFNPDAVQLVSRKVASVSGDARRALDICRRATELVSAENKEKSKSNLNYLVGMKQVDAAVQEMFCSSKISALRNISSHEQLFLKAIVADFLSTGVEETTFQSAAKQYTSLCHMEGAPVLSNSKLLSFCSQLYDTRLLLLENGKADVYQRIKLNISIDDINYALKDK